LKYSAKNAINRVPAPQEGTDYYRADKFDCTVAFEIHVPGYENEDENDIECRAYEYIKASKGDLESLGVMMKEHKGSVCLDMDDKPFNKDKWTEQKAIELKTDRNEQPLTQFFDLELGDDKDAKDKEN